jgi:maltooligosyltrehalose trehalohydrolase
LQLERQADGYFSGAAPLTAGADYQFCLDRHDQPWPDPASRFQPQGPLGPSRLVDGSRFVWHDEQWLGLGPHDQVLYELHVGTFTREGTWAAAAKQLVALAELGITALEIMPIAEFHGRFGWSYDGVNLFAPSRLYGTPDDLRRFVDQAHQLGIGVLLDVVYNHYSRLGERVFTAFSRHYLSERHKSEWGGAPNFDAAQSAGVREFFLANVAYWIEEFHFDGLRIDATQSFADESASHILVEICQTARRAAGARRVLLVGENEPQRAELLWPADQGGCGFDALWNDDFHHSALVRLTGRREAYYTDYTGSAQELVAAAQWGYLYQGQRYSWQQNPRGTPALDRPAHQFVNFLENHDQLANSLTGQRVHQRTSPGRFRALTALWLLAPQTPLLFQGQEFGASTPFLYFNDAPADEAPAVLAGRAQFMSQFRSVATATMQARLPNPCDQQTFACCQLDPRERDAAGPIYLLHRDLLRLRRDDPVIGQRGSTVVEGGQLSDDALLIRFLAPHNTRLLVVNFAAELRRDSIAHPLVAPPRGCQWQTLWSSDDPRYAGPGSAALCQADGWVVPGESATLLAPVSEEHQP